ncbi:hypothetical protein EVAR_96174_1 [Eumeta japonica]|uniref:Uncharacterized protein n=1 Tax=Eumeta variegata TaxID=151549 RepID=A0A4C1VJK5_EUMVA|nr:hypothetical protein EVAR_96174_1 [Eumeta japonica]
MDFSISRNRVTNDIQTDLSHRVEQIVVSAVRALRPRTRPPAFCVKSQTQQKVNELCPSERAPDLKQSRGGTEQRHVKSLVLEDVVAPLTAGIGGARAVSNGEGEEPMPYGRTERSWERIPQR